MQELSTNCDISPIVETDIPLAARASTEAPTSLHEQSRKRNEANYHVKKPQSKEGSCFQCRVVRRSRYDRGTCSG